MKFKSRQEEAMFKFAQAQKKAAQDAAWEQQLRIMKTAKSPCLHPDHKLPTTRRELVSAGLLGGLGAIAIPGLLGTITTKAYAIEPEKCKPADAAAGGEAAAVAPGYLHIELSGGAGLSGNMVFGKQAAGADLELYAPGGYGTNRWGDGFKPQQVTLDTTFGAPFHPESRILQGIKSVTSPEAQAKIRAAGIAGTSADDNRGNPLNPVQLVTKLRSSGALTGIAAQRDGNSGGRTAPLDIGNDPSIAKALVSDEQSLANLVDPGLLAERLSKDAAIKIAETAGKLSESKLAAFNKKDLNAQVQELIACGYLGSKDLLTEYTEDRLRPSNDTAMTTGAYGSSGMTYQQLVQDGDNERVMVMSKLLTEGLAAGATMEMGGYDYHGGNNFQRQVDMDMAAGIKIGLALETAHRKGAPLMIAVTTDGSVASQDGNGLIAFRSDSGARGAALMFAIGTDAAPEMVQSQIGKYSDAGAVDTSYLVTGNSPNLMALAIAYNFAAFSGNMAMFDQQVAAAGASNPFSENEYLAFAPKK